MKITNSPTRTEFPLSKKKIIKKTLSGIVGNIILVLFLASFASPFILLLRDKSSQSDISNAGTMLANTVFLSLLILISVTIISYFYQVWYFATYYYDLNDNYIIIRKNPITPREINLPYERIQDIYVDQDILDRILGIYDVHLSSATIMSGMEAHIDGLEKTAADGLRQRLLSIVSTKLGKDIKQIHQNG